MASVAPAQVGPARSSGVQVVPTNTPQGAPGTGSAAVPPTNQIPSAGAPGAMNPLAYQNSSWDAGMPVSPQFVPDYSNSMAMLPAYQQYMTNNSQGYNDFAATAMNPGQSNWANLAETQQGMEAQDQQNKAVQSNDAATAQADNQLAMTGGLSSGARERVAEGGATNLTGADQGIARQQGLNDLQIQMNDAQNKQSMLGQLPGMETSRAGQYEQVAGTDLQNQINENQAINQYNQNLYNQQTQAWGASQQAQATENSGKK